MGSTASNTYLQLVYIKKLLNENLGSTVSTLGTAHATYQLQKMPPICVLTSYIYLVIYLSTLNELSLNYAFSS